MVAVADVEIDVSTIDFSDLEKQFAVDTNESSFLQTILIVDNVPVVDESKEEKLVSVLRKIITKTGANLKEGEEGLCMPMVDDPKKPGKKTSKGFLFVDCETQDDADKLLKQLDQYKLDKSHVLAVNRFADFERFLGVSEEYVPPKKEEYKEKEHLTGWLMDSKARDQYIALAGEEVHVYWNNKSEEPEMVHKHSHWTDTYLQWSSRGSYIATFHKQGIALWGGESWKRFFRLVHPLVKLIEFSPCENYLVTWSNEPIPGKDENLRIWDIRTGTLLRGFSTPNAKQLEWPYFRWSHDGKYGARMLSDGIAVYELPEMKLLDNKVIKIDNLKDFAWSPKENTIAYWTPEVSQNPARVNIISIPDRSLLRSKNLFMVNECKLYWQSEGDYLLVKIDRYTKTKKSSFTNLEVFCLRGKDVPIDTFEGLKEMPVLSLAWEPTGDRFAIIAQDGQKIIVGLYRMEKDAVKELKLMERKNVNTIFWSPKGHIFVLAGLRNFQGELEFWDADDMQLLATGEHFQASEVEWDPTGRYLVSTVSFWRHPTDTGYILWDFKGQLLLKKNVERFKQLLWRPRPPSLLSKEQMKKIRKNLKSYSDKFDDEDSHLSGTAAKQVYAARKKLLDEWYAWRKKCEQKHASQREARAKLRGGEAEPIYSDSEDDTESDEVEEWIEEVIEETEEIVVDEDDDD